MKRLWWVVLLAGCGGVAEVDVDSAARAITALEAASQARDVDHSNPMPGQPPAGDPTSPASTTSPSTPATTSPGDPARSNPMPGAPAAASLDPAASNPMPGTVATPSPAAAAFADQTR